MQNTAPPMLNVPGGQGIGSDVPGEGAYVPGGAGKQNIAPPPLNMPGAQGIGTIVPKSGA